ncbi:SAM-dependent methyltransferase [Clostridioides difficile]
MEYIRSKKYFTPDLQTKIMGPNPIKLQEELLQNHKIPSGSYVCDLGSGQGLTSVFLAKEYGFVVFAVDLWSEPKENEEFFKKMGLSSAQIKSVKADANELKFEKEFFDAVVSTDSYNYFGRDPIYLDEKLLPFVKKGGFVYITVPGMKKDCHEKLPEELLLSWTPEELDYIHDITYWSNIISHCKKADLISIYEMESNSEVWSDWIKQNNEYAINDRKAIEAGGGDYLNFIAIILQKINSLEPNTIICVLICLPIDINNFIFEGNDLKIEEYKKIRN